MSGFTHTNFEPYLTPRQQTTGADEAIEIVANTIVDVAKEYTHADEIIADIKKNVKRASNKLEDGGIHPKSKRIKNEQAERADHITASRHNDRFVENNQGQLSDQQIHEHYNNVRSGIRMQRGSRNDNDNIPARKKRPTMKKVFANRESRRINTGGPSSKNTMSSTHNSGDDVEVVRPPKRIANDRDWETPFS